MEKYHYKQYYTAKSYGDSKTKKTWIYNAKTGKFTYIGKNIEDIGIGNKHVYFLKQSEASNAYELVQCDLNGKHKKSLTAFNSKKEFYDITESSCILMEGSMARNYYKFTFSTGELREINL